MAEGTTLGGSSSRLIYQDGAALIKASTTEAGLIIQYQTLAATGTAAMSTTVPQPGAELIEATFTVLSAGTVTTSGTQQLAVGDGTNLLAISSATDATSAAGTIVTLTPQSVNNAKANTAVAGGTRMVFTNTEVGTIGDGMHGMFRVVWSV